MGLDMYLTARVKHGTSQKTPYKYNTTIYQLHYWRKANAIHALFVKGHESDVCGEIYVPRETLEHILGVCKQVLEDNTLASDLAPVMYGCFFGSDKYDEDYFGTLKDTAEISEKVLNDPFLTDADFYYSASW